MKRACTALVLLALALAPVAARANGRFPASVDVEFAPGDDQFILFPVTFGLLLSRDDGQTWHWVCENSVGYTGTFDPDYAVQSRDVIWATTFEGLRVSRDGGCSWESIAGALAGLWIGEVEIGPDGRIWAASSSGEETVTNDAFVSTDGTGPFTATGLNHPFAWWRTLKIAPTDGDRIYVSGYVPPVDDGMGGMTAPEAIFYRSINGGGTWQPLSLADVTFGDIPSFQLFGVSPTDPDQVFAVAVTASNGIGDVLYRSDDGGMNWAPVLTVEDVIDTVYIAGDGRVAVGIDTVSGTTGGVHMSTDHGDTWSFSSQPKAACLGRRGDGTFFSCGSNGDPDLFALGRSTDMSSWSKVLRFSEIAGPLSCAPGTIQFDVCESQLWPTQCERVMACTGVVDAGPGADAGEVDAGGGGGGGTCCGAAGPAEAMLTLAMLPFLWPRRRRRR